MSHVNGGPDRAARLYAPTQVVTGSFPRGSDIAKLRMALDAAGFAPSQLHVFAGQVGVDELELKGVPHGAWVRFRRMLSSALDPFEAWVFHRAEDVLRSGGVVVAITLTDETQCEEAVKTLEAQGGKRVRYWAPGLVKTFL